MEFLESLAKKYGGIVIAGVEGAIYYDSTTKKHYGFDGTTWNALY